MFINQSIKENFKPTVFIIIVLMLLAVSAYPQHHLGGKVVEILDGKTFTIELFSGGQITAELQHIEIPESDQPLYRTTIDHLTKLVFAKTVEFRPLRIVKAKTVGQILLNGVDVSRQMIRDGAAWYSAEKTGQDAAESANYQSNEVQAKTEKRGVWSIEGLKPARQLRAEAAEKLELEKKLALENASKTSFIEAAKPRQKIAVQPKKQLNTESGLWSENSEIQMPKGVMNVGGLLIAHDPSGKLGFVGTPPLKFQIVGNDNAPIVSIGMAYFYAEDGVRGIKRTYVISVESESRDFSFLKNNNLLITADKQKINVGKARRTARKTDYGVKEILTYYLKRDVIEKIADAGNVSAKVGIYNGKVDADIQSLLKNLLRISE